MGYWVQPELVDITEGERCGKRMVIMLESEWSRDCARLLWLPQQVPQTQW